jgi:hypothetical protein
MTDPLTDAVRRLKGLQEDVERLKSAQDEEGEPRILFSEAETAVVSQGFGLRSQSLNSDGFYNSAGYQTSTVDSVDIVRPSETETASANDSQSLRSQTLNSDGFYNSAGYQTSTVDSVEFVRPSETETASVDGSQSLRSSNVTGTATYSDTSGYNTSTYNS